MLSNMICCFGKGDWKCILMNRLDLFMSCENKVWFIRWLNERWGLVNVCNSEGLSWFKNRCFKNWMFN